MTTLNKISLTLATALFAIPACLSAQGVDKNMLLHPPPDSWPTYHGDYSGRRFSTLDQINKSNVATLTLPALTRRGGGRPAKSTCGYRQVLGPAAIGTQFEENRRSAD